MIYALLVVLAVCLIFAGVSGFCAIIWLLEALADEKDGWAAHFAILAIWQVLNVVWGVLLSLEVWSML